MYHRCAVRFDLARAHSPHFNTTATCSRAGLVTGKWLIFRLIAAQEPFTRTECESVENRDQSQPSETLFCHRFASSPSDLGLRPGEGF